MFIGRDFHTRTPTDYLDGSVNLPVVSIVLEWRREVRKGLERLRALFFEEKICKNDRRIRGRILFFRFLFGVRKTGEHPSRSELVSGDISSRIYWSYWEALVLKEEILYKKWEAPNLKSNFLQFVAPRKRVKEILQETHDSPFGGHFGINKTLEKIRKRFFWVTCKQNVEEWCRTCEKYVFRRRVLLGKKSLLCKFTMLIPPSKGYKWIFLALFHRLGLEINFC